MSEHAPGGPGIPPTWTSSTKDMVGCSLGISRVWFTLGFGIINEVYYPRVDIPQIRDLGFIVGDGEGFWAEVKRIANYRMRLLAPGVPAVEIMHEHARYSLRLRVTPDSRRDVLAVECRLEGDPKLKLYVLLAPRLGATGYGNNAWVVYYRKRRALCAAQGPFGLALVAVDEKQRDAFGRASAGYVGDSDGWQDFARNGAMTWEYASAGPGNVALIGELPRTRRARARFRQQRRIGSHAGDFEPAAAFRQPASTADCGLAGMAGATQRTLPRAARHSAHARRRVRRLGRRAPYPPRQDLSGGDGGEPERPLGRHRERAQRIPSRMAARSRRDRGRVAGARRGAGSPRRAALPDGHATRGWALASKPMARRLTLLARDPARRNCFSSAARRGAR